MAKKDTSRAKFATAKIVKKVAEIKKPDGKTALGKKVSEPIVVLVRNTPERVAVKTKEGFKIINDKDYGDLVLMRKE